MQGKDIWHVTRLEIFSRGRKAGKECDLRGLTGSKYGETGIYEDNICKWVLITVVLWLCLAHDECSLSHKTPLLTLLMGEWCACVYRSYI